MTKPSPGHAGNGRDDTLDLIEDSLQMLAQRRAKYLGDDLAAISLLASLVDGAQRVLTRRVAAALTSGQNWQDIARALETTPTEVRIRFDGQSTSGRMWLHEG